MEIPKSWLDRKLSEFSVPGKFSDVLNLGTIIVAVAKEKGMTTVEDIIDALNKE